MQLFAQPGIRIESTLLGALGDRICVDHLVWHGQPGGDALEFDRIRVLETDDHGLLRAAFFFDPDARPAAFAEAVARFASGEAAGCVAAELLAAFLSALNDRARDALRETCTPDLVVADHRPLIALGVLDRDAWVAALQAIVELSAGIVFEVRRVLAWNDRGLVVVGRRSGSIPDGGGPFENFSINVVMCTGNRIARYKLFDEGDAERAVARFEELCAKG